LKIKIIFIGSLPFHFSPFNNIKEKKMLKLFDTHAHINLHHYNEDREEVIERMFAGGVEKIVIPGVDMETITSAIAIAGKYPGKIYAGIGFHPTDAIKWEEDIYQRLKDLAKNPCVVAIGEIGLDYYWDTSPKEKQFEVLKLQIELAKELSLPLIIHTRESHADTLEILKESGAGQVGGIFHCFSGDFDFALKCIDLGFYISFAGNITFKNAQNLRDAAREIPLDKILIETDSPYLTPVPNRGKRNEPLNVQYVAKEIAGLKNLTPEAVAEQTFINAHKVFKLINN
jgi:TatD DNase family protein